MASKRALERRLSAVEGFEEPCVDLEQYQTPARLAADLVHLADLHGDLDGTVVDLGAGTGILALGAACRSPTHVVGLDRDPASIRISRQNERTVAPPVDVSWLVADAASAPLCLDDATVLMNPPFGAQAASAGDRPFLSTASRIAAVSYSIHNAGSRAFVEAFAGDAGGRVTHAFGAEIVLDRQFPFHDADEEAIDVEVFRVEWD